MDDEMGESGGNRGSTPPLSTPETATESAPEPAELAIDTLTFTASGTVTFTAPTTASNWFNWNFITGVEDEVDQAPPSEQEWQEMPYAERDLAEWYAWRRHQVRLGRKGCAQPLCRLQGLFMEIVYSDSKSGKVKTEYKCAHHLRY